MEIFKNILYFSLSLKKKKFCMNIIYLPFKSNIFYWYSNELGNRQSLNKPFFNFYFHITIILHSKLHQWEYLSLSSLLLSSPSTTSLSFSLSFSISLSLSSGLDQWEPENRGEDLLVCNLLHSWGEAMPGIFGISLPGVPKGLPPNKTDFD